MSFNIGANALSVSFADSSPKGRAKKSGGHLLFLTPFTQREAFFVLAALLIKFKRYNKHVAICILFIYLLVLYYNHPKG